MMSTSDPTQSEPQSPSDKVLSGNQIESFAQHLMMNGNSSHTIRAYKSDLNSLLLFLDEHQSTLKIGSLESLAAHYITENRGSWEPSTVNRKLAAFRAFASYMGHQGFLNSYRSPTVAKGQPHPLPGGIADVVEMIETARKLQHKCLITLCGLMGCRVSEALKVRPSHVDLESMMLKVYGKGDKHRFVPMADSVFAYLSTSIALNCVSNERLVPLEDRAARRAITRIGQRAIGRDVASHDLRMTFGTYAFDKCRNLRTVQELMGHASSTTTEGYTGVTEGQLRDAADLLGEIAEDDD